MGCADLKTAKSVPALRRLHTNSMGVSFLLKKREQRFKLGVALLARMSYEKFSLEPSLHDERSPFPRVRLPT